MHHVAYKHSSGYQAVPVLKLFLIHITLKALDLKYIWMSLPLKLIKAIQSQLYTKMNSVTALHFIMYSGICQVIPEK